MWLGVRSSCLEAARHRALCQFRHGQLHQLAWYSYVSFLVWGLNKVFKVVRVMLWDVACGMGCSFHGWVAALGVTFRQRFPGVGGDLIGSVQ